MLCLIVEIVQYLKPLPPLLYKSTFSLYTILFLLTSQKKYLFTLLYTSYYCTCTTYYTLYPTFFVHIFFVVVLLFSTATLLHFFVFVLHTFCIIFFLSFMNKRTVFSLLFLFLFKISFRFYIIIAVLLF